MCHVYLCDSLAPNFFWRIRLITSNGMRTLHHPLSDPFRRVTTLALPDLGGKPHTRSARESQFQKLGSKTYWMFYCNGVQCDIQTLRQIYLQLDTLKSSLKMESILTCYRSRVTRCPSAFFWLNCPLQISSDGDAIWTVLAISSPPPPPLRPLYSIHRS